MYICDVAYIRDEMKKLERKMLKNVGFDLGYSVNIIVGYVTRQNLENLIAKALKLTKTYPLVSNTYK